MDYLGRLPGMSSSQKKISNLTSRSKIQAEQSILDRIQRTQLKWYGHLLRMNDSLCSKRFTSGHRSLGEDEDLIIME